MKMSTLVEYVTKSRVWRSFFRHGWPDNPLDRALVMTTNIFMHIHPVKVKRKSLKATYSLGLGILSAFVFLELTITGVLLMFYYAPAIEHAYGDIVRLQTQISFGQLLRNLHRWSAHAMVILVIAHMARVFHAGAYRPPREFNWVVGVLLLVLTFFLSFTGYLLPWDQLSYWAVTVGANMAAAAPVIGHLGPLALAGEDADVRALLLGDRAVGAAALVRFYVLHCVLVPVAMGLLMAMHFFRVRRDGGVLAKY